ncbi:hypothetical protein B0A55_09082 [Friedmanniomyces simplex]|uniref:Fe2OG dioxygenase domain-containing protein n=1 Tax=Friedmanniomyces simplex TaxID=329884 RepID=A0A4U0X4F6_9PEZI|nr:hypothetical protein B0A55_09082 [Friedmanniomyces simplex]
MSKRPRTLDAFFAPPPAKKRHIQTTTTGGDVETTERKATPGAGTKQQPLSNHPTYPFAIPHLPPDITDSLNSTPATEPQILNNQPDLDLLYYRPYIPQPTAKQFFHFLRRELPFYRVKYTINRGGALDTPVTTPRFTTVFGLDETARFDIHGQPVSGSKATHYACRPRPIPQCLDHLRALTEQTTHCKFNVALVNYYASGADSIAYHSDSEHFLGPEPAIASFTLGTSRDFLLKHVPTPVNHISETRAPMRLPLKSGEMVLMRGRTQSCWLHSVPKRKGGEAETGRMNITFRQALVRGGTENYYRYNVGEGEVYKWDEGRREMVIYRGN